MPRRLAQRMTLSDLEWPFHTSRAISAVAELLVCVVLCEDEPVENTDVELLCGLCVIYLPGAGNCRPYSWRDS